MKKQFPTLESLEQFLFEVPPYATYALDGAVSAYDFFGIEVKRSPGLPERTTKRRGMTKVDAHCPYCQASSTFTIVEAKVEGDGFPKLKNAVLTAQMYVHCARNYSHKIDFFLRINEAAVEKVGQYPSLADIANDEVSAFRKGMERQDAAEFHKAIGLAAHGVGVGSFVYLRRVFERLIYRRFEEFKEVEGWNDDCFYKVRMEDKIALLKEHLPSFLVENRKVYSILSVGIHELDEKECLQWFDLMKQSIVIILEDDKKKKEELERRSLFANAIKSFGSEAIKKSSSSS